MVIHALIDFFLQGSDTTNIFVVFVFEFETSLRNYVGFACEILDLN